MGKRSFGKTYHTDQIAYLRADITFEDDGKAVEVGILPAGAVICKAIAGVNVSTAFNAGTGNVLDIGSSADDDLFATDLALGSAGFKELDESVSQHVAEETKITATPALSGSAATAGVAQVVIPFIPPNRT